MKDITKYGKFTCIDKCEACGKVTNALCKDSRLDESLSIRIRRKECGACGYRWNTFEINESDFLNMDGVTIGNDVEDIRELNDSIENTIKHLMHNVNSLEKVSRRLEVTYEQQKKNSMIREEGHE